MKWLIGLGVVQTLLLAVLGLRIIAIDMRTDELAGMAESANLATQSLVTQANARLSRSEAQLAAGFPAPANGEVSDPAVADETLRMIIREELAALSAPGHASGGGGQQAVTHSTRAAAQAYDPSQAIVAQTAFDQDFDRLKNRGRASDAEMAQLQMKIAELPPEAQRAALIKLTRAINNGEIAGRL